MRAVGMIRHAVLGCWIASAITAVAADGPAAELRIDLPEGQAINFVLIEPGRFAMGTSPQQRQELGRQGMWDRWSDNELPQHEVEVSRPFYLAKTEVTQGQWEAVMGEGPWRESHGVVSDPDYPAVEVSWHDVQELILRLNERDGPGLYRLPTEAEWEYACRAGTTGPWSFTGGAGQLEIHAWYHGNTWARGLPVVHRAGEKRPNPWGLYDMHGNVWEWCQDRYERDYYSRSPAVDPPGPSSGTVRVLRGGVFPHVGRWARATVRGRLAPGFRDADIGARLVRRVR